MEIIEFYVTPDGDVRYRDKSGREAILTKFSSIVGKIQALIKDNFPIAYETLRSIHQGCEKSQLEYRIVEHFIRCNFGSHNLLSYDIEGQMMNFEEVSCPLRGKPWLCKYEGTICKPKGASNMTLTERTIADMYKDGYNYKDIAVALGKSPSCIKWHLYNIKNKLGIKNCRGIIKHLRSHNI